MIPVVAQTRRCIIVVFDDFLVHASWKDDEKRAWDEAKAAFGLDVEVVAASLLTKQVVLRITAARR